MARSFSRKHNGTSAGRMIVVLAISTAVFLTGTIYTYAAVTSSGTGSTSGSVYGPSHLKGPLTAASVSATTQAAVADAVTFSVGGPSHLTGALK